MELHAEIWTGICHFEVDCHRDTERVHSLVWLFWTQIWENDTGHGVTEHILAYLSSSSFLFKNVKQDKFKIQIVWKHILSLLFSIIERYFFTIMCLIHVWYNVSVFSWHSKFLILIAFLYGVQGQFCQSKSLLYTSSFFLEYIVSSLYMYVLVSHNNFIVSPVVLESHFWSCMNSIFLYFHVWSQIQLV